MYYEDYELNELYKMTNFGFIGPTLNTVYMLVTKLPPIYRNSMCVVINLEPVF